MNQSQTTSVSTQHNLRDYVVITLTYWVFTLTDGAIRMLILLFLHEQGHAPLYIASLFLFYEFFGVITNLAGGWVGAKFGLKSTLYIGLILQIIACTMMIAPDEWFTLFYLLAIQGFCGIAKDMTKMSAKSYIKLVVPESDRSGLMKWVAILTGSKNALKGIGFFLGALLLSIIHIQGAGIVMACGLFIMLIVSGVILPGAPGKSKSKVTFKSLFSKDPRLNWLSAARFFLFGSRDIWFVLALPLFLSSTLGWSHWTVGAFLAIWVIGYGIVQASAPKFLHTKSGNGADLIHHPPTSSSLSKWTLTLIVPMGILIATLSLTSFSPAIVLVVGLAVFGIVFAFNSAIHSYLVIHYAEGDKVALNVGFYYMANAAGRLVGTLLSGLLYQLSGQGLNGLIICITGACVLVILSWAICQPLKYAERQFEDIIPA